MIRQPIHGELLKRLQERRRFVQVLAGPRQVGKTTGVRQVKPKRQLLVGGQGLALEEFLSKPAAHWPP
jgi:predicted AAA+ superfamily ATPase